MLWSLCYGPRLGGMPDRAVGARLATRALHRNAGRSFERALLAALAAFGSGFKEFVV